MEKENIENTETIPLGCARCGTEYVVVEKSGTLIRCTKCRSKISGLSPLGVIVSWNLKNSPKTELFDTGNGSINNF